MSDKPQAAETPAGPEKKGGVPLLPIVGLVLILNVLMVGKIFLGSSHGKESAAPAAKEEQVGAKMTLEEFLVNLSGSNEHYLKMTLALGLKKGETEEKMKEEVAPIRDAILATLSPKTTDDLATEPGKDRLKKEIVEKVNKELGGDKVVKVYFLSFATQ